MSIKMQKSKKFFVGVGLMLVCTAATVRLAWAEGSTRDDNVSFSLNPGQDAGNHGVNRVIRTNNGYSGVKGTVDISHTMPTNEAGIYETAVGSGTRDAMALIENGPSAYLGGVLDSARMNQQTQQYVRTQVDVGLQFYPATYTFSQQELLDFPSTRPGAPPGWSIFFYLDRFVGFNDRGDEVNVRLVNSPRVLDPQSPGDTRGMPYRVSGDRIAGVMNFSASATGAATFTFMPSTAYGTFGTIVAALPRVDLLAENRRRWEVDANHPGAPWADGTQPALVVFAADRYADGNVKRVVAMTRRDETSELDGTKVTADWSGCEVRPHNGAFRGWIEDDVDQAHTGYDVPRLGALAFDKRHNGQPVPNIMGASTQANGTTVQTPIRLADGVSRTIIQFDADPSTNASMMHPTTGPTHTGRYANESVTINLGMIARPVGAAVR